ncbi:hypothetical protein NQ318_007651 [Aromia moschata]|uniref:Uncharacterized protein n=1 Tax=Aromia moschata TaxID=1265417 RepID=A0AAV8XMK0_9CUCU|nr:hypothetical protein NQ318_007651 [Aromia moschata]
MHGCLSPKQHKRELHPRPLNPDREFGDTMICATIEQDPTQSTRQIGEQLGVSYSTVNGNLTGAKYLELLQNHIIPAIRDLVVPFETLWFQHDGCPAHNSRLSSQKLVLTFFFNYREFAKPFHNEITPFLFKNHIIEAVSKLFGEVAAAVNFDLLKYDPVNTRAILRVPKTHYVKLRSSLTLCCQYEGILCAYKIHKSTPLLLGLQGDSRDYNH